MCIVSAVTVQQATLTQCSFLFCVQWAPPGSNARPRPLSLALGDEHGSDHKQDERRAGADRHPDHGHSGEGTMESSKSAGFNAHQWGVVVRRLRLYPQTLWIIRGLGGPSNTKITFQLIKRVGHGWMR